MLTSFPLYVSHGNLVHATSDTPGSSSDYVEPTCILRPLVKLPDGTLATIRFADHTDHPTLHDIPHANTIFFSGTLTSIPILNSVAAIFDLHILQLRDRNRRLIKFSTGYLIALYNDTNTPIYRFLIDRIPTQGHTVCFDIIVPNTALKGEPR